MKNINFYIPGILRFSFFFLLLLFSFAIIFTTNKNVQNVGTTTIQSLTDTAFVHFSAVENTLRGNGETDFSDIKSIFSDRTVAYALIAQKDGIILFHTNPALINTKLFSAQEMENWINAGTVTSRRITLGTGVPAYEFNFVMYRPEKSPLMLRLVLNTNVADQMLEQAKRIRWFTGLLIGLLWIAGILFERYFTHRIKTQAARENQKRLTIIGQMTAALAHEIRNALGSVKGYAQLLDEKAIEGTPQKDALAMVVTGAMRIEALVHELLLYSKEEIYHDELVEVAPLVGEVINASAPDRSADMEFNIPPGTSVKADREKLFRVIANGIRNALDAMGDNGSLRIYSHESSRWVDICIEDTGVGISGKDHEHLFTPFYTTKTDGTGLGLAYAKKVVEGMGGLITLKNRTSGVGALLTIQLPNGRKK